MKRAEYGPRGGPGRLEKNICGPGRAEEKFYGPGRAEKNLAGRGPERAPVWRSLPGPSLQIPKNVLEGAYCLGTTNDLLWYR